MGLRGATLCATSGFTVVNALNLYYLLFGFYYLCLFILLGTVIQISCAITEDK